MFIDKKLTILSQLFVYYILVFIGHKRHVLSFKSILKMLPIFSFTMTTNKETFTTTLISFRTPIIITMILFFRFPPIITTMLFLRTPAIIFPGHSFIPPFNRIHTILCFSKRMACLLTYYFTFI